MDFFNSKHILSNKRYGWIDYDRGISIILVTYRHCYESIEKAGLNLHDYPIFEYINVFFFGFRMPLFFIASGIFVSGSLRKRGLGTYSKNRVQTILYPLLVWGFIQISLQILFSDYTNSEVGPMYYWYLLSDPRVTGQFWYLNALFCVGILYASFKQFLKFKIPHQLILGAGLYFFAYFLRENGQNWGFAMDVFKYYLFFAIGDLISSHMLTDKTAKVFTSWKLILPLFVAFMTIQYFFTKINMSPEANDNNYYVENHMPFFFLLVALVGCAMSIAASFSLKKYSALPFLRVIGYNSVHIYCMQIIAMSVTRLVLTKVVGLTYIPALVILVLMGGLIIPMITYNICLRLNMWWLFTLKKPEDEINYLHTLKAAKK